MVKLIPALGLIYVLLAFGAAFLTIGLIQSDEILITIGSVFIGTAILIGILVLILRRSQINPPS